MYESQLSHPMQEKNTILNLWVIERTTHRLRIMEGRGA